MKKFFSKTFKKSKPADVNVESSNISQASTSVQTPTTATSAFKLPLANPPSPEPKAKDEKAEKAQVEVVSVSPPSSVASPPQPWVKKFETAIDISEKSIKAAQGFAGLLPDPARTLVGAIASLSLSTIATLKEKVGNDEKAISLAKYVADLVKTICQFLEPSKNELSEETQETLGEFEQTLRDVLEQLQSLKTQSTLKQLISSGSNAEVIAGCDRDLNFAFQRLQMHFTLHNTAILAGLEAAAAEEARQRLLTYLSNAGTGRRDKALDHDSIICLPGTRVKVLKSIEQWAHTPGSSRMMWISGVAGCGKTAVAATIAHGFEQLSASAIFHYSSTNASRNDSMPLSISEQIIRWRHNALEHLVLKTIKEEQGIVTADITRQFQRLIFDPLRSWVDDGLPVVIVIDGLDEWSKRDAAKRLIQLIQQNDSRLPSCIKFVIASRNEAYLSTVFKSRHVSAVLQRLALDKVDSEDVELDIRAFFEARLETIRDQWDELREINWPGEQAFQRLTTLSGRLFQWASTLVRYLEDSDPRVRLEEFLEGPEDLDNLDSLYTFILQSIFQGPSLAVKKGLLQHVLGCIVTAPTPTSVDTIAYLGCDQKDQESVKKYSDRLQSEIVDHLGSLLIIPDERSEPIRVLHPSVFDFFTDAERCRDKRFYVFPSQHHGRLCQLAFQRMARDLRRNVCETTNTRIFNEAIPRETIERAIPSGLKYACRYWAIHLQTSDPMALDMGLAALLEQFTLHRLLNWLEVLGLSQLADEAPRMAMQASAWYSSSVPSPDPVILTLLGDVHRFVVMCWKMINTNVHHIYSSGIACTPQETELHRRYNDPNVPKYKVLLGPNKDKWSPCEWITVVENWDEIQFLVFSSDGKSLASGGSPGGVISLWDCETGFRTGPDLEQYKGDVKSLEFFGDDEEIVARVSDQYVFWEISTGRLKRAPFPEDPIDVTALALCGPQRMVAVGLDDGTLELWNVGTEMQKVSSWQGHKEAVTSLAFSSSAPYLVSTGVDNMVSLWDLPSCKLVGSHRHGPAAVRVKFSPDGRTFASVCGSDNCIFLWTVSDESSINLVAALKTYSEAAELLVFSPDGQTLATAGPEPRIQLWDIPSGKIRATAKGHQVNNTNLAFLPDGKLIASTSGDKTVRFWDVQTGQAVSIVQGHTMSTNCVAFASDGAKFASASMDNTIRLWDLPLALLEGTEAPVFQKRMAQDRFIRNTYPSKYCEVEVIYESKNHKVFHHVHKVTCPPGLDEFTVKKRCVGQLELSPMNFIFTSDGMPWFWTSTYLANGRAIIQPSISVKVDVAVIHNFYGVYVLDVADILPDVCGPQVKATEVKKLQRVVPRAMMTSATAPHRDLASDILQNYTQEVNRLHGPKGAPSAQMQPKNWHQPDDSDEDKSGDEEELARQFAVNAVSWERTARDRNRSNGNGRGMLIIKSMEPMDQSEYRKHSVNVLGTRRRYEGLW